MAATANQDLVKQRAFELHVKRGGTHGHDQEDWFQAEKEVLQQNGKLRTIKRANGKG